jgi:SAM-dependent methyltransferase
MRFRTARRRRINIQPEYSAQRRSHPPNPALFVSVKAVAALQNSGKKLGRLADLGCGKLRHYRILAPRANELFLIDTSKQLSALHRDGAVSYTVYQVAEAARRRGRNTQVFTSQEFPLAHLELDVVFCVAVFDVIPRKIRKELTNAAARNLTNGGFFVVIAPRNDTSILRRCSRDNSYLDGHAFWHHGVWTFFHNFRSYDGIVRDCKRAGLWLVKDMSRYRQVCLIFRK